MSATWTTICQLHLKGLTSYSAMDSLPSPIQDNCKVARCQICDQEFASNQVKDRHIEEIHNNSVRRHKCSKCDATFVREANMMNHRAAVHDKSLPILKCERCEKVFRRKGDLNRHVREVHERKVKVAYDCPLSTCPEEFARKDNLERHIARGKHSTMASCRFCKEEFVWKSLRGFVRILYRHYVTEDSYQGSRQSGRHTATHMTCINIKNE